MANLFDMHEKYHCLKPQVMFSIASLYVHGRITSYARSFQLAYLIKDNQQK
jgi:hypothetical protein